MRINRADTLAVMIDFQEKLMPVIYDKETVIKNAGILIKGLSVLGVPMIVTEQYTKGIGITVPELREALAGVKTFDKTTFSIYDTEEIKEFIKSSGRKNILICGTEAHICVLQSVIDLRAAGYNVFLVEDCIGSRRESDKAVGIKRALFEGAAVTTYEAALFELTREAGSPHFKEISKLIK